MWIHSMNIYSTYTLRTYTPGTYMWIHFMYIHWQPNKYKDTASEPLKYQKSMVWVLVAVTHIWEYTSPHGTLVQAMHSGGLDGTHWQIEVAILARGVEEEGHHDWAFLLLLLMRRVNIIGQCHILACACDDQWFWWLQSWMRQHLKKNPLSLNSNLTSDLKADSRSNLTAYPIYDPIADPRSVWMFLILYFDSQSPWTRPKHHKLTQNKYWSCAVAS